MKQSILFLFISVLIAAGGCKNSAQQAIKDKRQQEMQNKENRVSPPMTAEAMIGGNQVIINYGSPKVHAPDSTDRIGHIWGELVPYNEVWRTGANEATTITFSKDVLIEGQPLERDIYSLFTIPTPEEWTVIFNLNETQWGAFKYDASEDALRVKAKPVAIDERQESLKFEILQDSIPDGGIVRLTWEKLQVDFHFKNAPEK